MPFCANPRTELEDTVTSSQLSCMSSSTLLSPDRQEREQSESDAKSAMVHPRIVSWYAVAHVWGSMPA